MVKYIDFNTQKRATETSASAKDLLKLMNNAVYGKTMENVRKHRSVSLATHRQQLKRLTAKPHFKSFRVFTEDLVGVEMQKTKVKMNRPIYCGFTILEESKIMMYDFFYSYMRPKYGDKVKNCYMDTDSFVLEVETADIYQDILNDIQHYDTSDYPRDHMCYSEKNKKVVGKMKDEMHGEPVQEAVALRSKMNSIKTPTSNKKVAKGVSRTFVEQELSHEIYRESLLGHSTTRASSVAIQSRDHVITTNEIRKLALNPADTKRVIMKDLIHTLPYGHHLLEDEEWCENNILRVEKRKKQVVGEDEEEESVD